MDRDRRSGRDLGRHTRQAVELHRHDDRPRVPGWRTAAASGMREAVDGMIARFGAGRAGRELPASDGELTRGRNRILAGQSIFL